MGVLNIEDITRWREDMNFMFEWQELYLTSEHKIVPMARRTFPDIFRTFPKIAEDYRRLPKATQEDPEMFRSYTNKF